jgi:hypothetical protein
MSTVVSLSLVMNDAHRTGFKSPRVNWAPILSPSHGGKGEGKDQGPTNVYQEHLSSHSPSKLQKGLASVHTIRNNQFVFSNLRKRLLCL